MHPGEGKQPKLPLSPEDTVLQMLMPDGDDTPFPAYTLDMERADKSLLSGCHMVAALSFIGCTFASEGVMNKVNPGDFDSGTSPGNSTLSFVFAMIGIVAFFGFSMLTWLSGNYDEALGGIQVCGWRSMRFLQARRVAPCFVRYQRYPGHSGVQFDAQPWYAWLCCWCVCSDEAHVQRYIAEVNNPERYTRNFYDRSITVQGPGIAMTSQNGDNMSADMYRVSCCERPRAAWLGVLFIIVETVAFGMLVASVAIEAIWS